MKKVLVIDDEQTLLKNMGDFLTVEGYAAFTATNGIVGMDILKAEKPDLLLLDLHLKEGPIGIDVLKEVKSLHPNLKVIVFSGFGDEEDVRGVCISLGADLILSKPSSLKNIAENVEKLLEGK